MAAKIGTTGVKALLGSTPVKAYLGNNLIYDPNPVPISDLTGTKWIFKSELWSGSVATEAEYQITFTSNNISYSGLYSWRENNNNYLAYGETIAYANVWQPPAQKNREILITGGTDVTNATLIAWLEANAVQVNVFDLTGTEWVFKNTIDVSTDFDYHVNFLDATSVDFYKLQVSNDVIFGGKSLFYISDEDGYDVTNTAFNSLNGWQDNSYKTIEFISGTDIANPDLIVWLTENAIYTTPTPTTFNNITVDSDIVGGVYYRLNNGNWTLLGQGTTTFNNVEKLEFYYDSPAIADIFVNGVNLGGLSNSVNNPTDTTPYLDDYAVIYIRDND